MSQRLNQIVYFFRLYVLVNSVVSVSSWITFFLFIPWWNDFFKYDCGCVMMDIFIIHFITLKTLEAWLSYKCRSNIQPLIFPHSLLPWLQLDGDVLYLSQAADIGAYDLRGAERGRFQHNRVDVFSGHQEDVCRFTLTDAHVISAGG